MAQYRFAFDPSIEITRVHDDNLFYSDQNRVSDVMLRVRPALGLLVETPRWSAATSYELDNNRYETSTTLNDARARQQALIDIHYQPAPRLTFGLNGAYTDTDTPAELNIDTGLATSRIRAQQAAAARAAASSAVSVPSSSVGPALGPSGGWAIPYAIVLCESGGQNLPPNSAGASGYYQILPSTWSSFGGTGPAAYLASKSEQDAVASRIWNGGAGASNWVCAGIVGIH